MFKIPLKLYIESVYSTKLDINFYSFFEKKLSIYSERIVFFQKSYKNLT